MAAWHAPCLGEYVVKSRRDGEDGGPHASVRSRRTGRAAFLGLLLVLLALPASEAAAAIAFVKNVGTAGNTTTGTTIAVTVPAAGVAVNNTVIVTFAMDPATGTVSVADSGGNTYTGNADIQNGTSGSGTGVRSVVFSSRLTTALVSGNTITVTHPSVAAKAVSINEFSGLAAVSMLDRTSTSTGTSTAPTSNATAATQQASELLLGAIGVETNSTETFTAGTGYTALTRAASSSGIAASNVSTDPEFQIVSASGTFAATGTLGASRLWAAAIATYRAAVCGNGTIEPGEQCDDGNTLNGDCCSSTCQFESAATVCRAAAGGCDVAENCTGTSGTCPANQLIAAGTVCRPAAGTCDVAESCTGTSAACPTDQFVTGGTTCRAMVGPCDVAETCSGTSATCPADRFVAAGTACRASVGPCDVAETCTGTSATCPADQFLAAGVTCRAAAGVCDVAETCSGTSATCPADARSPAGTPCPDDGNRCTLDQCDGTNVTCQHPAGNAGAVCRAAAGACDVAETCTGTSATCPADVKSTAVCRPAVGACDVAETCDGTSNDCPADAFLPAATVCRPAADLCDVAESCSGTSGSCPADQLVAAGTLCRASAHACDRAEACTGTSVSCPPDAAEDDGTPCSDGNPCTIGDACRAGACVGTTPVGECPDRLLCYKAKPTVGFKPVFGYHLVDVFDARYYIVAKPLGVCLPAATSNEPVTAPSRRLDAYAMKAAGGVLVRQSNVKIVNELGAITLDTGKPKLVRIPATPIPNPTPDPNAPLDHYKCFKVFYSAGTPKLQPGLQVTVSDGFTNPPKTFMLRKPLHLCMPADANSQGERDPNIVLLCYAATRAPGQPRHIPELGVQLSDEFGTDVLNTVKELEYCVPSVRLP